MSLKNPDYEKNRRLARATVLGIGEQRELDNEFGLMPWKVVHAIWAECDADAPSYKRTVEIGREAEAKLRAGLMEFDEASSL